MSATLTPVKRQTDELSPPRIVASGFAATDVSLDGRMAVGTCTDPQSLCVREIESGQMRTLVPGTDTGSVVRAILSPTSRDVAYAWTEKVDGKDRFSIRLIGTDKNAQPRTLTSSEGILSPADWSPDGKTLLLVVAQGLHRSMVWMSVADGSMRPIKSFENWRTPRAGQVSPDGNFISFEDLAREGSNDWYIYIMDRDGQHEEAVVKMAGMSGSAKWTPDAAHLVFRSNRTGRPALWSVPVDRGRAVGEPKLLQIEGPVTPIVITASGELFYHQGDTKNQYQQAFVAERTMSGTRIVKSFNGEGVSWSPDGKSLAYLRVNPAGMAVAILSTETGEERAYPNDALGYAQLRWMPDGSGVVAVVRKDAIGGTALYCMDARTGVFRRLFSRDSSEQVRASVVEVAPDGRTIYMPFRSAEGSPWRGIVAVDLQTLTEKVIVTFAEPGYPGDGALALAVSPDGATLVVQVRAIPGQARLLAVRTDGNGYRELYGPFPATVIPSVVKWSRDGRSIFFFTHTKGGDWRLLRIPAEGGEPEADGLDTKSATASVSGKDIDGSPLSFDLSPDGTQIAFGAWRKWVPELRSIANILPHLNGPH